MAGKKKFAIVNHVVFDIVLDFYGTDEEMVSDLAKEIVRVLLNMTISNLEITVKKVHKDEPLSHYEAYCKVKTVCKDTGQYQGTCVK